MKLSFRDEPWIKWINTQPTLYKIIFPLSTFSMWVCVCDFFFVHLATLTPWIHLPHIFRIASQFIFIVVFINLSKFIVFTSLFICILFVLLILFFFVFFFVFGFFGCDSCALSVIPQTCKYKGRRFECGLSISCVLAGGKPVDSCSGGMIWSCCVDKDLHQESSSQGLVQNASKYNDYNFFFWFWMDEIKFIES